MCARWYGDVDEVCCSDDGVGGVDHGNQTVERCSSGLRKVPPSDDLKVGMITKLLDESGSNRSEPDDANPIWALILCHLGEPNTSMSVVLTVIDTLGTVTSMRLQLAINVANLDESIEFYSRLFGTEPYKVKDGYANWAVSDPPLKFVIFEQADAEPGSVNHLGVEVDSAAEVVMAERRLSDAGLTTTGIDDTICCYAEKVETWVTDPSGHRWEYYVKTADHDTQATNVILGQRSAGSACCG